MATPEPRPDRAGRRLALWALQIALTVVVTAFILRRVGLSLDDLAALGSDVWPPRWTLFALACALLFAGYVASAWIWSRMVVDLGGPPLPLVAATEIYLLANLGRYVPGKLWQIAGMAVLALKQGVPVSVSTAAAVLGQAVALGGAAMVGGAALSSSDTTMGGWSLAFMGVLALALAVLLVPPLNARGMRLWFRLAGRGQEVPRTSGAMTLRWLLLYALNWALYAAAFLVLVKSFALPGPPLQVASAFAAAYVLGYAAIFAPAGIGVREGFLIVFLTPLMGAAQAGAIAIVARVWTTAVELVPAAVLGVRYLLRGGESARQRSPAPIEPPGQGRGAAESAPPPGSP